MKPDHGAYSVPVSALKQVRAPSIPHGYPVFIPFWNSVNATPPLDLNQVGERAGLDRAGYSSQ